MAPKTPCASGRVQRGPGPLPATWRGRQTPRRSAPSRPTPPPQRLNRTRWPEIPCRATTRRHPA
eukprot:5067809-Lingulodinium_polyedra.AAC.1